MTLQIVLTLAVTAGALALFIWNRIRMDVVGLLTMAALIVLGLVTPAQGISGFANEAVVTVAAMFVLSAGLLRTGAIDVVGRLLGRIAGESEFRLLVVSLCLVVPVSAFINNTPVVVVMIPIILGLARSRGVAPSRLFMPISFGSQMGGTLTLIGTSTNLLVAGLVLDLGVDRIRLFDITPPALVLMLVGVAYLLTVGRWLTPVREASTDLVESYELRDYLTALIVGDRSPLSGRTLRDTRFGEELGLQVVSIERDGELIQRPRGGTVIERGDVLHVRGKIPDIARVENVDHLSIVGSRVDVPLQEEAAGPPADPTAISLAEVIVTPRSPVLGQTLRGVNFRGRYGMPVLGIQRHGAALHDNIADVRLRAGDVLLVEGSVEELRALHEGGDLALIGAVDLPAKRTRKLKYSVPIVALVVGLAAFEVTTILVSAILGVAAMFLTGCLKPDEAYEEVDWMVIVLLGTTIPLGIAMQNTGTAEMLAMGLVGWTEPLGPLGVLGAFYLFTTVLTAVISNNAAAVVLTPIAVATGLALGVSPLPFVIAVMIAASNSFMTPIGYQTNVFIYGPGGYRFTDFLRVGAPLTLLLLVTATFVIPVFFPF